MSDAIKKLHDYLTKSPSVVYPQDVLDFLPAIKAENYKLLTKLSAERIVRVNVEAENDKLRQELDYMQAHWELDHCPDCTARLDAMMYRDENAKLRELARLMWKPYCWAQSGYETCLTDDEDRAIRDKVRELRVEVGE